MPETWESYEPEANMDFRTEYAKTLARNSDQTGMRGCFRIMYGCKCWCVAIRTTCDWNGRILAHIVTLWTMAASIRQLTLGCKCSLVNGYILGNARLHLQHAPATFCIMFAMVASTWAMYGCRHEFMSSILDNVWLHVFDGDILHTE